MNLFNYLMTKKGHNASVREDLFAYLLANKKDKIKTITGTVININDAKNKTINRLEMSKLSSQDEEPTPENPVEIQTVKGYRNKFDKDNATYKNFTYKNNDGNEVSSTASGYTTSYTNVNPNTTYTISGSLKRSDDTSTFAVYFYDNNKNWISRNSGLSTIPYTFTTPQNCYFIQFQYIVDTYTDSDVQIVEGTEELPYVPYGSNYVYTKVTNGTDTNYFTIPLNGNEIAGIGDYKDELIVDSDGHCWLNKLINKKTLIGSDSEGWWYDTDRFSTSYSAFADRKILSTSLEGIISNYFIVASSGNNFIRWRGANETAISIKYSSIDNVNDFKTWLSAHNTEVLYPLATPQLINLNYDVDIRLFNGVNNISNSDDMDMILKYYY